MIALKKIKRPSIEKAWFKLDNAGKIFPGQSTSKWSNIFRMSVILKEKIDPELLSRAVEMTLPRFPCFDVRLRKGLFWYYFEKNDNLPPVMPDIKNPCQRVKRKENNGFLFRVYYYEKRISVEFFHALTDAYGTVRFLNTLTAQYLRLLGHDIPPGESVLDINEPATEDELSDPFPRFASSKAKLKKGNKFVYHVRGTKLPAHMCTIVTGTMPLDQVKAKAKEYGVTITELISAELLYVHYQMQRQELSRAKRKKDISVQIPVNLRNFFPTKTLRNFSLTYIDRINPNMGEYTFEEMLKQVALYLRYVNNEKMLNAMITGNLKLETNPIMRVLPLFIKDAAIGLSFRITGEKSTTVMFSNIGIVKIPEEMQPYVDRYVIMSGPGKLNGARCAGITYGNSFEVTIVSLYQEMDIQREFFRRMVKLGIPVKIESNILTDE